MGHNDIGAQIAKELLQEQLILLSVEKSSFRGVARATGHHLDTIKDLLAIYQAYHNLIDSRHGKTPCMREGIVSKYGYGATFCMKD